MFFLATTSMPIVFPNRPSISMHGGKAYTKNQLNIIILKYLKKINNSHKAAFS
jgi:hypothetical protein